MAQQIHDQTDKQFQPNTISNFHPHTPMPLHRFPHPIDRNTLPSLLNDPFSPIPPPICLNAQAAVDHYLRSGAPEKALLAQGKMIGVLIVESKETIGFLAAYSGNRLHNDSTFFVPPLFDLTTPNGFFRTEEEQISRINRTLQALKADPNHLALTQEFQYAEQLRTNQLHNQRRILTQAKQQRTTLRLQTTDPSLLLQLTAQSQHQKAEYKRLERRLNESIAPLRKTIEQHQETIDRLTHERHKRSIALQERLFRAFRLTNSLGQTTDLLELFHQQGLGLPPSGAGECTAPKLLQYAINNQLRPIAIAEYWYGTIPQGEIRQEGQFYPACRGRCRPILHFLLQGITLQTKEPTQLPTLNLQPLYNDETIIAINKPSGRLAVPGLSDGPSILEELSQQHNITLYPVHRLDRDTSGILLFAKTPSAQRHLQSQFHLRSVKKEYIALVQGSVMTNTGSIDLPIAPDYLHRPTQKVDYEHGKPALTHYQVIARTHNTTRLLLTPHTGRTHQLRIHCAHIHGLACPILGDTLYGQTADRLHLHAQFIHFIHPLHQTHLTIHSPCPF